MALVTAVCAVGRLFTRRRGEILLVAAAVVDVGVSLLSGHDGPVTRLVAAQSVSTKQDVDSYSTRAKRFVRCPFYTKSAHLHHPLSLHNVYENQREFILALENP